MLAKIALRAEEHTLQIECEASRAEVEHAVRAAAEAADAASEQHAETLELYATREEAERSREAARSAGKVVFHVFNISARRSATFILLHLFRSRAGRLSGKSTSHNLRQIWARP